MFLNPKETRHMYVLERCFLKKTKSEEGYQNYDIKRFKISQIFDTFFDGYFVLTNTKIKGKFYLTLEALRKSKVPLVLNLTLSEWFALNQKKELDVIKDEPKYKTGIVNYSDAILAGYKITRIGRNMPLNANISNYDRIDLHLSKQSVSPELLMKNGLFSVSGFIHRPIPFEDGVALRNGGETFNNTKTNTVGVMSFKECGELRYHDIDEQTVKNSNATVPLSHELLIDLKEPIKPNHTVFLVVAGHLVIDTNIIEIVNEEIGLVKVRTRKLNILDIILNSVGRLNLDNLGIFLDNREVTANKVQIKDIYSDVCIRKLFSLPQSFLVSVKADMLSVNRIAVQTTGLGTAYEFHEEPSLPLITSRGLIQEYWKRYCPWGWLVKTTNDIEKFKLNETNISEYKVVANEASYTYKWYHDKPEFVQIVSTSKIKKS